MNNQRSLNFSHLETVQYFRSSGQRPRVETNIYISDYIMTSNTQPKESHTIRGERRVLYRARHTAVDWSLGNINMSRNYII